MSSSSPADLAVAFRSVTRRLHEAQGDAPHEITAEATAELLGQLEDAGRLLGCAADPAAVADAIGAVSADRWDDATLDQLRAIALDVGRLLRHIQTLTVGD
jgi:hypothetical protein